MYRLRRYFPPDTRPGAKPAGPPVLMVHPMMMSADMWDVTRHDGAVGILHQAGIDPWVIDFGSPDQVEGGMQRNLADHVVALSEAIDTVKTVTDRDVHLAGYSQGGMFAYQTAAYRRSKDLASIIGFGAPVDTLAALPMNLPAGLAAGAADFMADHVFSRIDIPGWLARTGFQMLDPIKTAQSRLDFLRQLHDREALLPREQQRRFLSNDGWIAWSGPAIAELLKQFIAHNRMMSGGFSIHGDLVTLSRHRLPRARRRRRGRRHRPTRVGAWHQAGGTAGRRLRISNPHRAFRPRRGIQGRHADMADGGRVGQVALGRRGPARRRRPDAAAARRAERERCPARIPRRTRRGRRNRDDVQPRPFGRRRIRRGQQVGAGARRRDRPHPAEAGPARSDQRPHPHLARPDHDRADRAPRRTGSSCSSTAACTPTRRSTDASTTSSAGSSRSGSAKARTSGS